MPDDANLESDDRLRTDSWRAITGELSADLKAPRWQAPIKGLLRTVLERQPPTVQWARLRRLMDRASGHVPTGVCSNCGRVMLWRELVNHSTATRYFALCRSCRRRFGESDIGDRPIGQVMVEFALILPIFLMLIVGQVQVGYWIVHDIRVENAAIQGSWAGAVEPAPPLRCARAKAIAEEVLREPIDTAECSSIGDHFTLTLADRPLVFADEWENLLVVHASATAIVTK